MKKPYLSPRRPIKILSALALAIPSSFLAMGSAHAAGSNMPWEQPLNQICLLYTSRCV